ncbi:MAG: aminodeoxychorismate/anthranilate synthase component II [Candidatus Eremiobacteraeota bacterium]|nr:aminodeoxychorismate/anthranilate synthase component II [Candidatus Eremiobacteraeota bacterium]
MKVLFVDNYDSFTYNVVHLLASQGARVDVMRNDDLRLTPTALGSYRALVIGPGPGRPSHAPRMLDVLRSAIDGGMPVLGVCLGLQAIAEVLGATIVHAPKLMHGKTSTIAHDASGIFAGLTSPLVATRYHSLCVDELTLVGSLRVNARSEDGVVQGLLHRGAPVHAVQFHPESVLSECGDRLFKNFLALAV